MKRKLRCCLIFFLPALLQWVEVSAQCFFAGIDRLGPEFKSTGNPIFDSKFNLTAADLESLFNIKVDLYFADGPKSRNAYATPWHPPFDGKVAFGKGWMLEFLWNQGKGEFAIAGFMAHEFAHVLQIKRGLPPGKSTEIHADFLAGYYFGRRGYLTIGLYNFINAAWDAGVAPGGSHGTPQERSEAVLAGYRAAHKTLDEAYEEGLRFAGIPLPNDDESGNRTATQRESVSKPRSTYTLLPPTKIYKPRRNIQTIFLSASASTPFPSFHKDSISTYGFSMDIVRNREWGWYLSASFNKYINEGFLDRIINEEGIDIDPDFNYYFYVPKGEKQVGRWEITLGISKKLFKPVWLNIGTGVYRVRTRTLADEYRINNGHYEGEEWVTINDDTKYRMAFEGGLLLNLRYFSIKYLLVANGINNGEFLHKIAFGISLNHEEY